MGGCRRQVVVVPALFYTIVALCLSWAVFILVFLLVDPSPFSVFDAFHWLHFGCDFFIYRRGPCFSRFFLPMSHAIVFSTLPVAWCQRAGQGVETALSSFYEVLSIGVA